MDYCSGSISTIPAWWIFWLCTLVNLPKRSMSQMSGTPSAETSKDKLFFSSISPLLSVVTFNFSDLSSVSGLFWFELVFGKNGSVTSLVLIVETVFGFKCGTVVDSFWVEITVVDLVPFGVSSFWCGMEVVDNLYLKGRWLVLFWDNVELFTLNIFKGAWVVLTFSKLLFGGFGIWVVETFWK